jgi:hypothetical protein
MNLDGLDLQNYPCTTWTTQVVAFQYEQKLAKEF